MSAGSGVVRAGTAALAGLLAAGCISSGAPRGFLRPPAAAQTQSFGGWFSAQPIARADSVEPGELLAATADSVWVLGRARGLQASATARLRSGQCFVWEAQTGELTVWAMLGSVSTLSHGVGLILSAPVWLIAGTASVNAESARPRLEAPRAVAWSDLAACARFPQGMPPGLDRASLRWPEPFRSDTARQRG
jgi:hypothetical protein